MAPCIIINWTLAGKGSSFHTYGLAPHSLEALLHAVNWMVNWVDHVDLSWIEHIKGDKNKNP